MAWIFTYTALNQLNILNPSLVSAHFMGSDTYLIVNSGTPTLASGWQQTKVVSVKDLTQMTALVNGASGNHISGVLLDLEGWSDTPDTQKADKATLVATYASGYSMCQASGLVMIGSPGVDLTPKMDPGNTGPYYSRWNSIGMYTALAPHMDVLDIQGQGTQNTLDQYTNFVAAGAAQAVAAKPGIVIAAGLTTAPGGGTGSTTLDAMLSAATAVKSTTTSFWLNIPGSSTTGNFDLGNQFLVEHFAGDAGTGDDDPPVVPPSPGSYPSTRVTYRFALGDHTSGPQWGFEPRSPSLTFYLSGQAHECTFTIDTLSPAGLNVTELADDVWVWRNNDLIFRGPVTNIQDNGGPDEHTLDITASSYRYRLSRLYTNLNDVFASGAYLLNGGNPANGPTLAWLLLSGHLGSSSASGQTDLYSYVKQGEIFSPNSSGFVGRVSTGTDIATAIDSLAQTQPFDWDMLTNADGNVRFTCWQPGRGSNKSDVLFAYIRGNDGTNCTFQRDLDVSEYGNRVYVNSQNTSGTQMIGTANASWQPAGRYTWIEDGSDLVFNTTAEVNARANTILLEKQTPTPSYTITPNEGVWGGPDYLWLGDQPTLIIRSGRLSEVHTTLSVNQITLAPADGNDNMSFSAGAQPFGQYGEKKMARGLLDFNKRIRALEWSRTSRGS